MNFFAGKEDHARMDPGKASTGREGIATSTFSYSRFKSRAIKQLRKKVRDKSGLTDGKRPGDANSSPRSKEACERRSTARPRELFFDARYYFPPGVPFRRSGKASQDHRLYAAAGRKRKEPAGGRRETRWFSFICSETAALHDTYLSSSLSLSLSLFPPPHLPLPLLLPFLRLYDS
jgi:hypothetical protein